MEEEYSLKGQTFFCHCPYSKKQIEPKTCPFPDDKFFERQRKVEWTYIVRPEVFAPSFSSFEQGHTDCQRAQSVPTRSSFNAMGRSWSYLNYITTPKGFKGIDCVRKVDELFQRMEGDLYNIVPEVGAINALMDHYDLAEVFVFIPQFGVCDLALINQLLKPPDRLRGEVARIYFYMDHAYPGRGIVTDKNRNLLMKWDKMEPVSSWECDRARKILGIQGNENPFVMKFCQ
jgi:deoxyribonuclease-1